MNSNCRIKWPEGIKKTKQRECVLAMLEYAELPLTAMDIYEKLEEQGVPLSTIYRILETFTEKGIAAKIAVKENGMAVYELKSNQHRHYAFCMGCHRMIVIENCPMEVFTPELGENNFHVLGHKLEIYGYCNDCFAKMA
jgi:Fur family transcriptional regulator, ferric uptake regulator